mmetsp:Transcript_114767/g.221195  ORF Transcript_114767/g.221195 Transcript_114767/m.221195 type:complete len:81 (+) Transcript_114767:256-498(+)
MLWLRRANYFGRGFLSLICVDVLHLYAHLVYDAVWRKRTHFPRLLTEVPISSDLFSLVEREVSGKQRPPLPLQCVSLIMV